MPPPYRESLADLARLDDQVVGRVIEELEGLPPFVPVTEIQRIFQESIGEETAASSGGMIAALLSLRAQLRESTAAEIAGLLSRAPELDLPDEDREKLELRVSAMLDTAAISTTAVAVDLQTQHERNFQSARIFTDLRPVFQDDLAAGPSGAVIVEMLELQSWNRVGGSEAMFIAMDEQDLIQLQGVVERAVKKTEALRAFLEEKGLPYFELEKGEA